jgi:putative transcriptional regulator
MTPAEVNGVRTRLGLSQAQLAQLLGVHPLTVSKWERGLLVPTSHHVELLQSFSRAGTAGKQIGNEVSNLLLTAGVAVALFAILKAAFDE